MKWEMIFLRGKDREGRINHWNKEIDISSSKTIFVNGIKTGGTKHNACT